MREAVIVNAARMPVGRYLGALHAIPAYDLAALVLNEVLKQGGCKAEAVDEVIFGQSYQSGEYVNLARMALLGLETICGGGGLGIAAVFERK